METGILGMLIPESEGREETELTERMEPTEKTELTASLLTSELTATGISVRKTPVLRHRGMMVQLRTLERMATGTSAMLILAYIPEVRTDFPAQME